MHDCHHRGVAATGTDWRYLDVRKSRKSTLLRHTRHELANDRSCSRRSPVSSKVERERRKAHCLARSSNNGWIFLPVVVNGGGNRRLRSSLEYAAKSALLGLVGSSVMAIWTIRHPNMLVPGPDAVLAYGAPGVWLKRPSAATASRLTSLWPEPFRPYPSIF